MPVWLAIALVAGVALMGIYGLIQEVRQGRQSPDARVLQQLRLAGSDLSRPHEVDFYLLFVSPDAAEEAAVELGTQGFEVSHMPSRGKYMCHAKRAMVIDEQVMVHHRTQLSALAARLGGTYDGWGAGVVKA